MSPCYERAVEMAWRGMTPCQIARELNINPRSVSSYLSKARKSGLEAPYFPSTRAPQVGDLQLLAVPLDHACVEALDAAGSKYGRSGPALARQILSAVLRDNLIDAVLDD